MVCITDENFFRRTYMKRGNQLIIPTKHEPLLLQNPPVIELYPLAQLDFACNGFTDRILKILKSSDDSSAGGRVWAPVIHLTHD